MSPLLPPNEGERLQTLRGYNILDTPPEVAFERITVLAARLFNVPICFVSLVDMDRLWLKACFGVDMRQASRELSFCAYAILSNDVMVVPDMLEDLRFQHNPLVVGPPHIRFYAGAPLRSPEGHNLGTLCVMDTRPRSFRREQQDMLIDLAAIVVDELELRRTARELREQRIALVESEEKFRQFAENISEIFWMFSPDDYRVLYVSPAYETIWGRSRDELVAFPWEWLRDVHPDDQEHVGRCIDLGAARSGGVFECEFRIVRPNGMLRWIRSRGFPIFNAQGQVYRIAGISEDMTRFKEAEEALRQAKATVEQANMVLEERVRDRTQELAQSQIEILTRLARVEELRDDETGQHTHRVAHISALLAQALGWQPEQVEMLRQAAQLHDVGKIAISDHVLLKPTRLTDEEYDLMKTHAAQGAALLANGRSEVVQMAERIAGSHHEKWDGSGYPNGLAGEQIPIEGRILAVADVFDALTHERPYKKAWSIEEAKLEIIRQSGAHFDPQVVRAFIQLTLLGQ